MSKAHKSKTPNIPPTTMMHLRLDALWKNATFLAQTPEQVHADLAAVTRGQKPEPVVQAVLSAYAGSPEVVRTRLDTLLPAWLQAHGYLATLHAQPISSPQTRWLAAVGQTTPARPSHAALFVAAFGVDDGSQASLIITWHPKPTVAQVRAMSFLIDYNPPWEGALKDIIRFPQNTLAHFRELYQRMNHRISTSIQEYTAAEAKHKVITALQANRAQQIRLPQDLITYRAIFLDHILCLPDAADTPAFTVDDFDFLSRQVKTSESLQAFEQTIGRRIRMEDGKELFIDAAIANDDFFDADNDDEGDLLP